MANSDRLKENGQSAQKPVIVAIGASAGGVQALQALFANLPEHTGAAFVVVVHLDPDRRSELPRILAARTRMPVIQVEHNEKLHPDHVYVIPPDRRLQLIDHELSPVAFDEPRGQRAAIDSLLRSMAERLGDGFAVILSGAGSDGALGLRAVKEAGGLILVQDPNEAEYGSMPRSAIATGVADFVLPVAELGKQLGDLIQAKRMQAATEATEVDEEALRRVLAHLRVRTGHDFSKYKRSTVLRRIARRMQVTRTDTLKDYFDALREQPEESQALLGDLLISVTTFFRDAETFDLLAARVLPEMFKNKEAGDTVRVWVVGCATGEEAYTMAILLLEEAARHEIRPAIQVFASDLDARALVSAREGRFPASIETDVGEERLRRFFVREGDQYRVRQEVRDVVLFSVHDLLKDPPFSRVDLITCRNVLIYLDREVQEQACSTFHYALNPGCYLLLGSSETADNPPGLFRMLDRNSRIYQSATASGEKSRLVPRLLGPVRVREQVMHFARPVSPTAALSEATMHRRAIEKVAPPSVLVDEMHRVLHLSDNAGRFITPSGGPLSGDIVDLVRSELRFELRSALHRAFEQKLATLSLPIAVRFNGAAHRVHIQVKPVNEAEAGEVRQALVLFIEGEPLEHEVGGAAQATDETVRRLSQELELTQARLRTVREESDAANEELRAANEELQSINEEYRSTSEELETSKEELQSINEELQTVNSELKLKFEAVSRAHSDLQNLMAATDIGTLFLDAGLRIKRFTERVTELFSLTPLDEGRPITDFAHQLEYEDLIKDVRVVLADLVPVRREIRSRNDRWYEIRMRPYRTVDDKIDGVVITFVDVTERRQVEQALRESEQAIWQEKRLVELSHDPIFIWDFDGGVLEWNRGSEQLYGYSRDEMRGRRKDEVLKTVIPGSSFDALRAKLLAERAWQGEMRHTAKDGRELTVESRIVLEAIGTRRLALESTRDVTDRRAWERRQELLLGELSHRVRNTLAVVQAIARATARHATNTPQFIEQLDQRLGALARAHSLLIDSDWRGADLGTLAREQLAPYMAEKPERLTIEGEPVMLSVDLSTSLALVLHELATNSARQGALSRQKGAVQLSWKLTRRNQHGLLGLTWRESGGPKGKPAKATGFGDPLLDHSLPGATVRREQRADSFECRIDLPLPPPDDAKSPLTGRI
jgi:two-component system, chemotaxis family, CheB/CheR fusion protein